MTRRDNVHHLPGAATARAYGMSRPLERLPPAPNAGDTAQIMRAMSITFHACKQGTGGDPLTVAQALDVIAWHDRVTAPAPSSIQTVRRLLGFASR